MKRVVIAMMVLTTGAGCSTSATDSARPSSGSSSLTHHTSPSSPPTNVPTITPSPSLDADLTFGSSAHLVWREHPGAGPGNVTNQDATIRPGSYRLQAQCLGGSLGITVNDRRIRDLECASGLVSLPLCLHQAGLSASAEWITGPYTDLVWQVVRSTATC